MSYPNADEVRAKIVSIVTALPEATATLTIGVHLKLEVKGKPMGWFMEDHHGDGRLALNCKALPGMQLALVEANPEVYHVPKYVGNKGWAGVWLDVESLDWDEVANLIRDAYILAAPKALLKQLAFDR